jgi:uncharacterized protein (TIGR03435 family)
MPQNPFRILPTLWMAAAMAAPALTQPKPAERPAFEVTSVKPNKSEDMRNMRTQFVGTRYSATNLPLLLLVVTAYNLPFQSLRLTGMPEWAWRERFDLDARAADDVLPADLAANQRKDRTRALLQSLLADRFQLAIHRETKEMPFYALGVSRNGPKMPKAVIEEHNCVEIPTGDEVPCHRFMGGQGRGLHGKAVNMQDLAEFIENWTDHPVLNQTSLQGLFSIESEGWVSMRQPPPPPSTSPSTTPLNVRPPSGDGDMADPARPTLFMVLAKLGLELKLQKGPIDIFVVDHIERPAAN